MKFLEFKLENVGPYLGGPHCLDLRPAVVEGKARPLIVIQGQNGAGKTTLLKSIMLAIHGYQGLGPGVSRARYHEELELLLPRAASDAVARVGLKIEHQPREGASEVFEIERSWWKEGQSIRESFRVWLDGQGLDENSWYRWDLFTRVQFPASVAPLFIFDGERAEQLLALASGEKSAGSYAEITGLDVADRLVGDLENILLEVEGSHEVGGIAQDLKEAKSLFKCLIEQVSGQEEICAELRGKRDAERGKREALELRLQSGFQEVEEARTRCLGEIQACEETLRQVERRQTELWSSVLPLAFCSHLAKRTSIQVERDEVARATMRFSGELQRRAEMAQMTLSQQSWANGQKLLDALRGLPGEAPKDKTVHELTEQDEFFLAAIFKKELPSMIAHLSELVSEFDSWSLRRDRAELELRGMGAEGEVRELLSKARAFSQAEGELDASLKIEVEKLKELRTKLSNQELELQELRERASNAAGEDSRLARTSRALSAVRGYANQVRSLRAAALEREVQQTFNKLSRKGDFLSSVRVDPDCGTVSSLKTGDGLEVDPAQLSAGEKQVLALAYLWALLRCDGRSFPIVIDTPFGRLDSEHRSNIVRDFLTADLDQVILLMTDEEATEGFETSADGSVSHRFHLEYDLTNGSTRVHEMRGLLV